MNRTAMVWIAVALAFAGILAGSFFVLLVAAIVLVIGLYMEES